MKMKLLAGFGTLLKFGAVGMSQATVYNPTTDFSITNGNPNGVWTYGQGKRIKISNKIIS